MSATLTILGMVVVTYTIKALVFILGDRIVFPDLLRQALGFIPVTVLTAIIVPMALSPHGQGLELSWRNPQLVGSIVAIAVCAASRHQLLTIVVSLITFFGWQFLVLHNF